MAIVPKVAVCVLIAGATSCGLLVIRQQRIEAAYQMSVTHRRLLQHEERSWRLRVAIHERLRQDRVAALASALERETGERLVPLLLSECYLVELPASSALPDRALEATAAEAAR
ncbi:MAG: hypothetical protein KJZ69_01990 [Phycisphaerales bacterium]|nr:hypothetical protein [Phycisphaerales bacterium]